MQLCGAELVLACGCDTQHRLRSDALAVRNILLWSSKVTQPLFSVVFDLFPVNSPSTSILELSCCYAYKKGYGLQCGVSCEPIEGGVDSVRRLSPASSAAVGTDNVGAVPWRDLTATLITGSFD